MSHYLETHPPQFDVDQPVLCKIALISQVLTLIFRLPLTFCLGDVPNSPHHHLDHHEINLSIVHCAGFFSELLCLTHFHFCPLLTVLKYYSKIKGFSISTHRLPIVVISVFEFVLYEEIFAE